MMLSYQAPENEIVGRHATSGFLRAARRHCRYNLRTSLCKPDSFMTLDMKTVGTWTLHRGQRVRYVSNHVIRAEPHSLIFNVTCPLGNWKSPGGSRQNCYV